MMMKIDEAINRVIDMYCNLRNGYIDHLTYGGKGDAETEADIHALDEVLTALDWYRSQDLIRRDETLHKMWNALWNYEDKLEEKMGLDIIARLFVQNGFEAGLKVVVDIPKVEYRGEVDEI